MNKYDNAISFILLGLGVTAILFCSFVSYMGGQDNGDKKVREEAVRNEAAHWEANPSGQPMFKWGKRP